MKKPVITYKYYSFPVGVPYDTDKDIDPRDYLFNVIRAEYRDGKLHPFTKKLYKRLTYKLAEDIVFRLERNMPIPKNIKELIP